MGQTKNLFQKRQKKPAYMQSLNEHEKAENFKIIDNLLVIFLNILTTEFYESLLKILQIPKNYFNIYYYLDRSAISRTPALQLTKGSLVYPAAIILQAAITTGTLADPKNSFRVEPPIVQFIDYKVNGIYEIPLKITNGSQVCKRVKFIPPTTEKFSIRNKVTIGKWRCCPVHVCDSFHILQRTYLQLFQGATACTNRPTCDIPRQST